MIALKPGVKLKGLTPQVLIAMQAAEHIWWFHGQTTLVVTSCNDGQHKEGSFHYVGQAVDFRIKTMPEKLRAKAVAQLKEALGGEFFVLHESAGTDNEHVHVQWTER
mgnify:CR=1 FL=1